MKLFGARTLRHPRRRNNGRQSGAPPMLIRLHCAVSRPSVYPYRRRKSAAFQRGGAVNGRPSRRPVRNGRFAVAQIAQDSDRGADTAGNLVNVG
jgi:hypothetical protein